MPITGTTGNDIIDGTSGADEIFGLAGNDTINGLEGNDTIYGGFGNDILNGGDGDDLFVEDEITSFNDVFNGGAGTDTIELRVVPNPIVAQAGLLSGHGMANANSLVSIERIVFASQAGSVIQGAILHSAVASSGLTEVVGGAGRDLLIMLTGNAAGTFTIPTITYTGFSPVVTNAWENIGDAVILVSQANAGSLVTLNAVDGLAITQVLIGGNGNDTLNGSASSDGLNGGGGTNLLNGNGGNDSLAIVNLYSPNNAGGFLPVTQFNGFGSTLDGGSGTDVLSIGGYVDLQATLVNIEGVHLQAGFTPPVPNTAKQDAAYLSLDSADIAMLPANAFFTGTGTVEFVPDDGTSLSLANYVLSPGHAVTFTIVAGAGNGLTFTGNSGDDRIELWQGTQTAIGGAGNDTIVFGEGNQVATGGAGADRFTPALGSGVITDFVIGEDKIDLSDTGITNVERLGDLDFAQNGAHVVFSADSGGEHYELVLQNTLLANLSVSDFVLGSGGISEFDLGTAFDDLLFGHQFNDELRGGVGNDRIYGGGGVDLLFGDAGDDVIVLDGAISFGGIYDGGAGFDVMKLRSLGVTNFYGIFGTFTGIERLEFDSKTGETLVGAVVVQALSSGLGTVVGGEGSDTFVVVATAGGSYSLSGLTLLDWGAAGTDTLVLTTDPNLTAAVTLTARSGLTNQVLIGAQGNDTLNGSDQVDFLRGGGGNDTINGGLGADLMYGDQGNDTFQADSQADLVFEDAGAGTDTIFAATSFYLYGNVENLTLTGSAGNFGVGNELDNVLTGNSGENLLIGWDGQDTINGGDARDAIFGVEGNDVLNGEGGIDYIVAGNGDDTLNGGAGSDEMFGQDGNDTLNGGTSFDTDIMVAGAGNDTLRGDSGLGDFDFMYGDLGDDVFYVDTPADLTFEQVGEGHDTVYADISGAGFYLYGNIEDLVLLGATPFGVGNGLDNSLTGNAISNFLLGGDGNDTLNGGLGNDVLFGEVGNDTFVFDSGTGGDVIGDFASGQDKIDVSSYGLDFAQLQGLFVQSGNVGAIQMTNGDVIVLHNITMSQLTATDFIFG